MTEIADMRVAVISSEQTTLSNRLWHAASRRCRDMIVIGPNEDDPYPDDDLIALDVIGPRQKKTFRHLRGLRRALGSFRPDLIHVNNELWSIEVLNLIVSRHLITSRPQRIVVHGAENQFHDNGLVPQIRLRLARGALRRLGGYASWNAAGAAWVAEQQPDLPRLVLPAIIPPGQFTSNSWSKPPANTQFQVLLVGRLDHDKGFDDTIRAIGVTSNPRAYQIHLCGVGPTQSRLQSLAESLSVDVVFHGHVPADQLVELMRRMHCLVQPSLTSFAWAEQFGRSVAEAMTVGLPCLVSSCGELPDVVGAGEFVFPERDIDAIAEALERLRRTPSALVDASRRQAERAAARWSPEAAATALTTFWMDVQRHANGGGR